MEDNQTIKQLTKIQKTCIEVMKNKKISFKNIAETLNLEVSQVKEYVKSYKSKTDNKSVIQRQKTKTPNININKTPKMTSEDEQNISTNVDNNPDIFNPQNKNSESKRGQPIKRGPRKNLFNKLQFTESEQKFLTEASEFDKKHKIKVSDRNIQTSGGYTEVACSECGRKSFVVTNTTVYMCDSCKFRKRR